MSRDHIRRYIATLQRVLSETVATDLRGEVIELGTALDSIYDLAHLATANGNRVIFIGNGGSAAVASHMVVDFTKNGHMTAVAFNDGSLLTCLANDLGFEHVFAAALELHVQSGDLLVAISSSGRSPDILNGVGVARTRGAHIVTVSGFRHDNPLRGLGDVNLYVPSDEYGFVEISHLALLHSIVDLQTPAPPQSLTGPDNGS